MVRVGFIGLGHMGQLHMLNAIRIDGVEIVAAADKNPENRKFAEKYHVKTYDDYCKLIDSEKLDAVIISLPNFLKKESVSYAAEKKLDIFLDKPISRNFAEAQEIVKKIEKEKVRMMVGVNYRYFPCVQRMKEKLERGEIGDAIICTSELVLNGPISHDVVPHPVPEWWLSKDLAGGGALIDLGYHLIDIFRWMFGDFDVTFSSFGHNMNLPVEDSGTVVLKSKTDNSSYVVNTGWFSKSIFPNFNFRINLHGTVGFVSTDNYIPPNAKFNAIKEGALNMIRKASFKKLSYLSYTYYYSSFYQIMDLFFKTLKNGSDFPVTSQEQLDVIRVIDSAYHFNGAK